MRSEEGMKTVTYEQLKEINLNWLADAIDKRFAETGEVKKEWTALDVLNLQGVFAEDKIRAVLREEFIPAPVLHKFARSCAERTLSIIDLTDKRHWKAIDTVSKWLKGEAIDGELTAERLVMWASDVAWEEAYAVWYSAYVARAVAWNKAWDARQEEYKWQIAELLKMLEGSQCPN